MLKVLKKVIISFFSLFGISFCIWICVLLNPNLVYSHSTEIENITIYHNSALADNTESIVKNALALIKSSKFYDSEKRIELCLNDNSIYPSLHPASSGTAYAFLNKSVLYACTPDFENNVASFSWEINNYELRKYNLTYLIAHEFTHNLQHFNDPMYFMSTTFRKINWKLEGHADYTARGFKHDGLLKEKIAYYLNEVERPHTGIPVFTLSDGTIQSLSYFKYAIVTQYLLEVETLSFDEICASESDINVFYEDMLEWYDGERL